MRAFAIACVATLTAVIGWYAFALAAEPGTNSVSYWAWIWGTSLAWIVIAAGLLGVEPDLGDRYHLAWPRERDGRIYERLGVRAFRHVVPYGTLMNRVVRRFRPGFRVIHDGHSRERWLARTRPKEAAHVLHGAAMLVTAGALVAGGRLAGAATLATLTLAADVYPAMLQRYNRLRLTRAQARGFSHSITTNHGVSR